jgi:hypothetical protein
VRVQKAARPSPIPHRRLPDSFLNILKSRLSAVASILRNTGTFMQVEGGNNPGKFSNN